MFKKLSAHLPFFVAVSKHLSFSKAAQELALSQSAISYQIRTLEDKLGFKLFMRGQGSKVTLSEKGKLIYLEYVHMEKQFNQLLNDIKIHKNKPHIKITAPVDFGAKIMTALLPALEERGLVVDLDLSDSHVELKSSKFDLAVRDNKNETGLEYIDFTIQENILLCSSDYSNRNSVFTHADIHTEHKIIVRDKEHSRTWSKFLASEELDFKARKNKQVIASSLGILEAVIAGVGIAILPRYFVKNALENTTLFEIESSDTLPPTTFYIAYQPSIIAERWALTLKDVFESSINN